MGDEFTPWRLFKELTIEQAALLICGVAPCPSVGKPKQYGAWAGLIKDSVLKEELPIAYEVEGKNYWNEVKIKRDEVKAWLLSKGITTGFFFDDHAEKEVVIDTRLEKILDPDHPWHSENLALAVNAWLELYADRAGSKNDNAYKVPGGNTKLIGDWLRLNVKGIGSTTEEHFRVIINPSKQGGPQKSFE